MIQQQDSGSQKKKILKLFLKLKIMLLWLHFQNRFRFSINQAVSGTLLSNEIYCIYFKCDCIAKLHEMKKLQLE